MPKFVTFDTPTPSEFNNDPIKSLSNIFKTLDSFTKGFIIVTILIIFSTPFVVNNLQIYKPHAQSLPATTFTTQLDGTVFIHYFPWYSSSPGYYHWLGLMGADGQAHKTPPDDIATPFYPKLGTYSVDDLATVNQQFAWIKKSGADVIVFDWWGQGGSDSLRLGPFMDRLDAFNKANGSNIKVAVQIDAYSGRTGTSVASDIKYIIDKYGSKPVFYRVNRPTKYGGVLKNSPRPMFFVWAAMNDSMSSYPAAMDGIHNSSYDSIVLVNGNDNLMAFAAGSNNCSSGAGINSIQYDSETHHSDGAYAWAAIYTDHCFAALSTLPVKSQDYIAIYSVTPGYNDARNRKPGQVVSRDKGGLYYNQWVKVTSNKVEAVAVSTFNEWLEGTQIEPAIPKSYTNTTGSYTYQNYTGDFNTTLTGAEQGLEYIYATAYMGSRYKGVVAQVMPTSTPIPTVKPFTGVAISPTVFITPSATITPSVAPIATSIPTVAPSTSTDTTAPSVSIYLPKNGDIAVLNQRLSIVPVVTDNVGIKKVSYYLDGSYITDCQIYPLRNDPTLFLCSQVFSSAMEKPGTKHIILIKAYDAAGNAGSSSVAITTQ